MKHPKIVDVVKAILATLSHPDISQDIIITHCYGLSSEGGGCFTPRWLLLRYRGACLNRGGAHYGSWRKWNTRIFNYGVDVYVIRHVAMFIHVRVHAHVTCACTCTCTCTCIHVVSCQSTPQAFFTPRTQYHYSPERLNMVILLRHQQIAPLIGLGGKQTVLWHECKCHIPWIF